MNKIRIELSEAEFLQLYRESDPDGFLRTILDRKLNAMIDRENYHTAYKDKKATPEEQERARREYLEGRGIPFH